MTTTSCWLYLVYSVLFPFPLALQKAFLLEFKRATLNKPESYSGVRTNALIVSQRALVFLIYPTELPLFLKGVLLATV